MYNVSCIQETRVLIRDANGLAPIMRLLSSLSDDQVRLNAVDIILSYTYDTAYATVIKDLRGILALLKLLRDDESTIRLRTTHA